MIMILNTFSCAAMKRNMGKCDDVALPPARDAVAAATDGSGKDPVLHASNRFRRSLPHAGGLGPGFLTAAAAVAGSAGADPAGHRRGDAPEPVPGAAARGRRAVARLPGRLPAGVSQVRCQL